MANLLRLVQIGIGGWGWSWINVAQQSTAWKLQAVVDVSEAALANARSVYGLQPSQTFTGLEAAC